MFTFIKLLLCPEKPRKVPADYYDKELEKLEREQKEDRLSIQIFELVVKTAELLSEYSPYPISVIQSIDNLRSLLLSISEQKQKDYYLRGVALAENLIFDKENTLLDESIIVIRKKVFDSFSNAGTIDLNIVQNEALDKYFLSFKDYWESAISELKRKDAIIKRRKYLVELTEKLCAILEQRSITKYSQLLLDYHSFNVRELELLRQ